MQDPQTTAYFYLVTVNPVSWTVLRPVQLLWGWPTKDWLLAWSCSCGAQQSSSAAPRGHTARGGQLLTSCHKPQPVRGTQLAATQSWGKHTQPSVLSAAPHIPFPLFPCALPVHTIPSCLSTLTVQDLGLLSPTAAPQSITAVRLVPYFPGPSPHTNQNTPTLFPY